MYLGFGASRVVPSLAAMWDRFLTTTVFTNAPSHTATLHPPLGSQTAVSVCTLPRISTGPMEHDTANTGTVLEEDVRREKAFLLIFK